MAESAHGGYQGLIAAGVLPETDWVRIAAGVSRTLADAARTGRVLPQTFEPLVDELVRRSLLRPTELIDVQFESMGIPPGHIRES